VRGKDTAVVTLADRRGISRTRTIHHGPEHGLVIIDVASTRRAPVLVSARVEPHRIGRIVRKRFRALQVILPQDSRKQRRMLFTMTVPAARVVSI
jgi:hypothetical protein